ncbi:MAG TPA: hypothetical protein VGF29_04355 [Hyphomicrobiaceae bacterium]|jgi:hypothetical protein
MRALLAAAVILGGAVTLTGAADARKDVGGGPAHGAHQRYDQPRYYRPRYHQPRYYRPRYHQPRYYYRAPGYAYGQRGYYSSEQAECERRARAEDPSGVYAGYPCWAREAFGRSGGGSRR